jgi:replicative DNA helicase|tara:strand:+ start:5031 stop:6548 length:1518 start_codon:yes stop_codon:yes gene_type:complete
MIYNFELEKQLLAGLLKEPESLAEISNFISNSDFYSKQSSLHSAIFRIIQQAIDAGDEIDEIIIAQRVNDVGLSFEDNLNPSDYIKSLSLRKVPKGNILKTAKELKKYSIRREILESSQEIAKKMKSISPESSYRDIIEVADNVYNSRINLYEIGNDTPENIYEEMEALVEERGNNPVTEFGMMGPHPKVNDIYGSLLRAGNITVIVARSGVGKTQFCMDYSTKVSLQYDVPVLHFDNGEMSKEELIMRQCAALSGVPMHLLESGKWRQAGEDVVDKVRSVWPKIKNLKFYYYNVGGMDVDSMVNTLKRFYYAKVGRGNQMVFSFDYIKTTSENISNKSEWQVVGEMVDKFKKCVQKEILHDGNPVIPMITSVQSNRYGITTNRNSENVVDDESIVSLSDRITQFCSHMFILRSKTSDEMETEGGRFGTHKLINVKSRHLGSDIAGAVEPVRIGDSLRKNSINLDFNNFNITERGDLRDIARVLDGHEELDNDGVQETIPDFDQF